MKLKFLVLSVLLVTGFVLSAQSSKKSSSGKNTTAYPQSFAIEKSKFDGLFNYKAKEVISDKTNPYLNKAVLVRNTQTGDMKFLLLKLNYFKNASLHVQVNGEYSTQVFIISDDRSVFYKGQVEKDRVLMTKCKREDIVTE